MKLQKNKYVVAYSWKAQEIKLEKLDFFNNIIWLIDIILFPLTHLYTLINTVMMHIPPSLAHVMSKSRNMKIFTHND